MTDLIDGVIRVGQDFGVQCLAFVNDITHGAGAGQYSAATLYNYAHGSNLLHSTPQLGDVAVWAGGAGGASGAGHAALVTAISPGGQVAVTGTNWPGGSGAEQTVVGAGNNAIGMGNPSGYIDPTKIGGQNIITGHFDPFGQAPLSTTTPNVQTSSGAGSLWGRVGWSAAGLGLIILGLVLVFRRDIPSVSSLKALAA